MAYVLEEGGGVGEVGSRQRDLSASLPRPAFWLDWCGRRAQPAPGGLTQRSRDPGYPTEARTSERVFEGGRVRVKGKDRILEST